MTLADDASFMTRALFLAARGRPSPNPHVGAVIVRGGKIIGEGYHRQAGKDHAEVEAIKAVYRKHGQAKARSLLAGSTIYVSLEPCSHFGRVPPCTDAILREKIGTVVFAMKDPNPRVKGNGEKVLRKRKVAVRRIAGKVGEALEAQALELNRAFAKQVRTGLPYVTLKMAMTLDGKVATRTGDSKWVGGPEELRMVQHLRNQVGAVMVGAGTVIRDNPRLTCRLKGGHSPLRVIVDGKLRIPLNFKVLKDRNALVAAGPAPDQNKVRALGQRGIEVLRCPFRTPRHVLLSHLLRHLASKGIDRVLCEGGPELNARLLEENLVDELLFSVSPKMVGGQNAPGPVGGEGIARMGQARKARIVSVVPLGDDWMIRALLD
ncbi:MAG: bifunctional diaminohydroxyphosphoribosylaminopyrimidine deaminase/5-amino-6-(5-phosphoribosylamino)uracil reductase RibD [Candidatus Micrarchaeota archaeon]|nr:bifunctional diaminohydroxyphosphoribosylaminopyrimidine deaminase/5-amino-6-(5-phosphoribosylamino)uracil reductase RibD [Candidatus Micrarchaeota archaeon]